MSKPPIFDVEPQYCDLVDFILKHPDRPFDTNAFWDWPDRNQTIDWPDRRPDAAKASGGAADSVASRLSTLTVANSTQARPKARSEYRRSVAVRILNETPGALYRVRRGVYVFDTTARWEESGRKGTHCVLADNLWNHLPNPRVAAILGPTPLTRVLANETPRDHDSDGLIEDGAKLTVRVDAEPATVQFTPADLTDITTPEPVNKVLALDAIVGGQVVIQTGDAIVIATVATVVPVVGA